MLVVFTLCVVVTHWDRRSHFRINVWTVQYRGLGLHPFFYNFALLWCCKCST